MALGRGECGLADADNEYATIDITIARTPISIGLAPKESDAWWTEHQGPSTARCIRQSLGCFLTGDEAHDLMAPITPAHDGCRYAVADKAFDADEQVLEP